MLSNRYIGRHRAKPPWSTQKKISSTLVFTGLITIPGAASAATPKEIHVPSVSTQAVAFASPIPPSLITPPSTGTDQQTFDAWVKAGEPGYIPDNKPTKGINGIPEPEPNVAVVQAVCDKPDLPGLSDHALEAYHTICALFPEITTFYGFRAGDQDHGTGNAIDNMVYGDTDTGNALADFLIAHADELHVKYIIWQQRIWQNLDGLRSWQAMEDRGSPTANHYDHVHLSVN